MRRVLRWTFIAFAALALILSAVIFIEREQPQIRVLPELRNCDKEMCLYGITPDKTTVGEAQEIIDKTKAFTFADYGKQSAFKQSRPYYRMDISASQRGCTIYNADCVIDEVDLIFLDQNSLTADQIVAQFGSPCAILPYYIPSRAVLVYPGMVLFFLTDPRQTATKFEIDLPLVQINLFSNIENCPQALRKFPEYYPWHGFTTYRKRQ